MKKLNLKMQGIGEMLSKEQMKNVTGGYAICKTSPCSVYNQNGTIIAFGQCVLRTSTETHCVCRYVINNNTYDDFRDCTV